MVKLGNAPTTSSHTGTHAEEGENVASFYAYMLMAIETESRGRDRLNNEHKKTICDLCCLNAVETKEDTAMECLSK